MERHQHKDEFEDFLRKSFEGYSEEPPPHVWEGIAAGVAGTSGLTAFLASKWAWVVAASVAAALFVGQHLYFNHKIENLTRDLAHKTAQMEQMSGKIETLEKNRTIGPQNEPANTDIVPEMNAESVPNSAPTKTPLHTDFRPGQSRPAPTAVQPVTSEIPEADAQNEAAPAPVIRDTRPVADMLSVPRMPLLIAPQTPVSGVKTDLTGITPLAAKKGWFYVGAGGRSGIVNEKIRKIETHLPKFFHGGMGGGKEPEIAQFGSTQGTVYAAGVVAGWEGPKKWGFESGLFYQKIEVSDRHALNIAFKDLKTGGGHPQSEVEVLYQYNTSAGALGLELRVSDADPQQDLPDDELISFQIQTDRSRSYLSVPALVTWRNGYGRLHLKMKAGLVFGAYLDDTLTLRGAASSHPKFAVKKWGKLKGISPALAPITTDYWLSAGLVYDLNPTLSINLEPYLSGSLSPFQTDRFIKSGQTTAGIYAGVVANF